MNTLLGFIFHSHMLWNNWIGTSCVFPSSAGSMSQGRIWTDTWLIKSLLFFPSIPDSIGADHISHRGSLVLLFAQHQEIFWSSFLPADKIALLLLLLTSCPPPPSSEGALRGEDRAFGPKNPKPWYQQMHEPSMYMNQESKDWTLI